MSALRFRSSSYACCIALALLASPASGGSLGRVGFVADEQGGVTALAGAFVAEVTPDGRNVHVSAFTDDALVVFARNPITGALSLVEEHIDGVAGVEGLEGAQRSVTSPDGRFVYVAGPNEDALAVFSRNPSDGSLSFVEVQRDGVAGVNGLDRAVELVMSRDGRHLYAAANVDDAVAVFAVNSSNGRLSFVEVKIDGVGGVDGLDGCNGLALSPDGAHLYTVSQDDDAITLFSRSPVTGALTFVSVLFPSLGPGPGIAISPDGQNLYVSAGGDSIFVYARNAGTGALTFVEEQSGDLSAFASFQSFAINGSGDRLYGASFNTRSVAAYVRDSTTGALDFIDQTSPGGSLAIFDIALSPDDRHIYAVQGDSSVWAFATAVLRFVQFQQNGVASVFGMDEAGGLAVGPDGRHVYVAGRADDAIALFDFDDDTGSASFVEAYFDGVAGNDGLAFVSDLALSPDGAHLYTAGSSDSAIGVFSRDPGNGQLTFVESERNGMGGVTGLGGVVDVELSPDGQNVYAAATGDNALAVFSRNSSSGELTFVESHFANASNGLNLALGVTVSPDGANVYTSAFGDDAVTSYQRNPSTGKLTAIDLDRDGVGGVVDLLGASAVAVSPDGNDVFAVARSSDSLVRFARSGLDGSLTFSGSWLDGVDGIDGLNAPADVRFSGDGRSLFVASLLDDAVAVFSRDGASGDVGFVQVERNGVLGVGGLGGADAVRTSPNGRYVFVAAVNDDALAILAPEPSSSMLGVIAITAVVLLGGTKPPRRRRVRAHRRGPGSSGHGSSNTVRRSASSRRTSR